MKEQAWMIADTALNKHRRNPVHPERPNNVNKCKYPGRTSNITWVSFYAHTKRNVQCRIQLYHGQLYPCTLLSFVLDPAVLAPVALLIGQVDLYPGDEARERQLEMLPPQQEPIFSSYKCQRTKG